MNKLRGKLFLLKLSVMAYFLFMLLNTGGLVLCQENNGGVILETISTLCCGGYKCLRTDIVEKPSLSLSGLKYAYVASPLCHCFDRLLCFQAITTDRITARGNLAQQLHKAVPYVPYTLWAPTVQPLSDLSLPRFPPAGHTTITSLSTVILLI